jgi:hypothetical protein
MVVVVQMTERNSLRAQIPASSHSSSRRLSSSQVLQQRSKAIRTNLAALKIRKMELKTIKLGATVAR